jgi:hypothetical protein
MYGSGRCFCPGMRVVTLFSARKTDHLCNANNGQGYSTVYRVKSVVRQVGELVATFDMTSDSKAAPYLKGNGRSFLNSSTCNESGVTHSFTYQSSEGNYTVSEDYPVHMKVGDALKDVNMNIPVKSASSAGMTITTTIHRTVQAYERVTSAAGSWMCFKIINTMVMQISGMKSANGAAIPPITKTSYEWYSPDIGMVKLMSGTNTSILSAIQ